LSCFSVSDVKACIEIGTFCMLSERRCAVTVISSSMGGPASAFSFAGAAADVGSRVIKYPYNAFTSVSVTSVK